MSGPHVSVHTYRTPRGWQRASLDGVRIFQVRRMEDGWHAGPMRKWRVRARGWSGLGRAHPWFDGPRRVGLGPFLVNPFSFLLHFMVWISLFKFKNLVFEFKCVVSFTPRLSDQIKVPLQKVYLPIYFCFFIEYCFPFLLSSFPFLDYFSFSNIPNRY